MSFQDIQIVSIRYGRHEGYMPSRRQPNEREIWQMTYHEGIKLRNVQREFTRRQREEARELSYPTATIQLKNAGREFHSVSLLIYQIEGGVMKGNQQIDFGIIPPGAVAERESSAGNWQIKGMMVDGQIHPMNRDLNPGWGGGGGFWRKVFSAPSM